MLLVNNLYDNKNQALTSNGDTPFRNLSVMQSVECMCGQGSFSTVGDQKVCMGDVAWSRRHKRGLGAVGGGIGNRIHAHRTQRHSDNCARSTPGSAKPCSLSFVNTL